MLSGIFSSVTVRSAWSIISMVAGVVVSGVVVSAGVVVVGVVAGGAVVSVGVVVSAGVVVFADVVVSGLVQDVSRLRIIVDKRMIAPIVFIMLFTSTSKNIIKNKTPQPLAKGLKRLNKKSYNSPAEYCRLFQGLAFWLMTDYPSNTVARPRRILTDLLSSYALTHARAPLFPYSVDLTLQY